MAELDLTTLSNELRPTGAWAAALLHALARDEAAGRWRERERLTEPRLDTWRRFHGRLETRDLVELLFEDAAVNHRVPFDAKALGGPLRLEDLPSSVADSWISALQTMDLRSASSEYVAEQAKLLGVPTRLARSDLHVVKPHQKVLELPGTGGQLAHHLVTAQRDLILHENFVVACSSWQELTLAGIIALELVAPHSDFALKVEVEDLKRADHPLRQRSFDFVIGLHPDKGGLFRVENQLAIWFPTAKVLLV
jgi:hypothetical protein